MKTPSERGIFSYVSPETGDTVYADPMILDMRLRKASMSEDMETVYNRLESPVEDLVDEGLTRFLPILYQIFDLKPVDPQTGDGVTAESILALFNEFIAFKLSVKKNTDSSPSGTPLTPPSETESTPSGPPSPQAPRGLETGTTEPTVEQPKGEGAADLPADAVPPP